MSASSTSRHSRAPVRRAGPPSGERLTGRRAATAALLVVLVAGAVVYLVLGRNLWFYSDEWDYIDARHLSDPAGLFRAHNGQWQTVPIIFYRLLLRVTGLRTYLPYLAAIVLVYLAVCYLLYRVALRAGVRPWLAAAAVVPLVFFGYASENVVFAAQLTYMGSILFGLLQVLLVTSPRRTRAHDIWCVVLGVLALMCSDLGVVTAVVVAAVLLVDRGWWAAARLTVVPAGAFLVWWLSEGTTGRTDLGETLPWVGAGLRATGEQVSGLGALGALLLVAVLIVGLGAASSHHDRTRLGIGSGLLLGTLVFLLLAGSQRAAVFGVSSATAPHYVGVVAALLMPVAAIAVDALWSTAWPAGLLALVIVLLGVPHGIAELSSVTDRAARTEQAEAVVLGALRLPASRTAPADMRPFPESTVAPLATIGYLRRAQRDHELPPIPRLMPRQRRADRLRLSLYQTSATHPGRSCREADGSVVTVGPGARIRIAGGLVKVVSLRGATRGIALYYNPNRGNLLRVLHGRYVLRLSSYGINGPALLCGN